MQKLSLVVILSFFSFSLLSVKVGAVDSATCSAYWEPYKKNATDCDTLYPNKKDTPTCSCSQDYVDAYTCYFLCDQNSVNPNKFSGPQDVLDDCAKMNYTGLTVPSEPNCPSSLGIPSTATVTSTSKVPSDTIQHSTPSTA
ncbi:1284_t:CDS:2 [Entrophospora sp. SA101]|nr:1284_t:CDS:2 [Entrophospora sp. SA101]